jgi:hypothetical protein
MTPAGPRTKNICAGNGKQQVTQPTNLKDIVIMRQKIWPLVQMEPENKNDCAGESQQ